MMEMSKSGILFLDKPEGETSFQSLNRIKKAIGTGKVGHTGTLDKFATGLLIVLTGKFTRLNALVTGMDKEYEAEITFGQETETLDPEGDVIATGPVPEEKCIRDAMLTFLGPQKQTPPLYSAVHVNGVRAHKLARKGQDAQLPTRDIVIYSFDFLSYRQGRLQARIQCSKGTYIRSLARDLGMACGTRAYVSRLNRTSIGPFQLNESLKPEEISGVENFFDWKSFFSRLEDTSILTVKENSIAAILNGVPFRRTFLEDEKVSLSAMNLLLTPAGTPVALVLKEADSFRYRIIFS